MDYRKAYEDLSEMLRALPDRLDIRFRKMETRIEALEGANAAEAHRHQQYSEILYLRRLTDTLVGALIQRELAEVLRETEGGEA